MEKDPKYLSSMVMTATPIGLVAITYEALMESLNEAIESYSRDDFEAFDNRIIKAQDIIKELMTSLDISVQLSFDLLAIYSFLQKLLISAKASRKSEKVRQCIDIVTPLYEGWKELAHKEAADELMIEEEKAASMKSKVNVVAGMTYGRNDIEIVTNHKGEYKA